MVPIKKNSIILVDASSYLYRAYYAFPSLTNKDGEPTGAIYGVLNMLKKILTKYQPTHIAIVFDARGKTFRNEIYKYYKSHRPSMPNDLCSQIAPLYAFIQAMGLHLLTIKGVEADDVIGTLALEAANDGKNILISTDDKDMAQLVSPKVNLINTMHNSIIGPEEVQLKFGVPPRLIVDYLSLTGDVSDNIPGIPGIGKKTAQTLLQYFGGLENLYNQIDSIANLKFRGAKNLSMKLKEYRKIVFISRQLAKIKIDVPLNLKYNQLKIKKPAIDLLILLCQRYDFQSWHYYFKTGQWLQEHKNTNLLIKPTASSKLKQKKENHTITKSNYIIINNIAIIKMWINKIRRAGIFAFNIKTDGINALNNKLIGFCFAINIGEACYIPLGSNISDTSYQLNYKIVLMTLKSILEDPSISKISQNMKFHYGVLKQYDIELSGILFDIVLESYVWNSVAGQHDLFSLIKRFLQCTTTSSFKNIVENNCNEVTTKKASLYAAEETDAILHLHNKLWPSINQIKDLKKIFKEIEMPLIPILSRIERTGILIDKPALIAHSIILNKRLEELANNTYKLAEVVFNISSNKQLQEVLYNKQKLPILKKTPKGTPSTSEEVLMKLSLNYSLPGLILEYRKLAKLKHTYIDKLIQMINPLSKRIHTSYHQAITITGRLSSSHPNIQNIPVRSNEGRRIRQAFIAPPNTFIMVADYSQIELRIMAHLTSDLKLLNAFSLGKDIHQATAAEVFGVSLDTVTQAQRQSAKTINFGLIYGMSAFGLARQLSITLSEAQKYINIYFERYPSILEYIERTRIMANNYGYVKTIDGRRLYLPDIHSSNIMRKRAAERSAINAPVQGTAADIIKRAMIAIDDWLNKKRPPVRIIMQVHDELVFEVQRNAIESSKIEIKRLMENCFKLNVVLQVDVGVGKNWDLARQEQSKLL